MKIIIEKVYQENNRLYCNITEGDKSYKLFFQVESPYANYLCDTRADAFLVTCLYRAAREGYDIECLVPVSERLLFQINTFMTTVLASVFGRQQIAITASRLNAPSFCPSNRNRNNVWCRFIILHSDPVNWAI